MIVQSMRRLFGEIERLCFQCKSGGRVCAVAAGFAAVMHALLALARSVVRTTGISQRLHVPCLFLHECVFATACIALSARNEQAKDRKHQEYATSHGQDRQLLTLQRSMFARQFRYIIFCPYYIIMGWVPEAPERSKTRFLKASFLFEKPFNKLFDYSSMNCKTFK